MRAVPNPRRRDLLRERFVTQHLAGTLLEKSEDVVRWLGAVQSQDYAGAKWSVGQRARTATDAAVDAAFASGKILRTHVLRPTWHFVTPGDIRWMLQLSAPHVHALNAYYYRKLELDKAIFARSHKLFAKALAGGRHLTRPELAALLHKAGMAAEKLQLAYIMMHAELDGLVCSGALRGKEHTYALLEERAPNAQGLPRDEALGQLARRFFTSHAPATLKHFVWWSGLSVADSNAALEMNRRHLTSEPIDGEVFWFGHSTREEKRAPPAAYLIPEYDESLIGSKQLGVRDMPRAKGRESWSDAWYRPVIIGGKRAGTWRRTIGKGTVTVETNLFASLTAAQWRALQAAAERLGKFLEVPARIT